MTIGFVMLPPGTAEPALDPKIPSSTPIELSFCDDDLR
jgi:hypothetical protein